MNEKQMRNWKEVRKLGFIGFILIWFSAVVIGIIIAHLMFGYEWIKLIQSMIGCLLGGATVQIGLWKRNEKKYREYRSRNLN